MKSIKIDKSFLTSKVARRIFTLFIFCTLLPLLMISGVTYFSVSSQLNNQAQQRLLQACKAKGHEIYGRLLFLETELKVLASQLKHATEDSFDLWHPNSLKGKEIQKLFKCMVIINNNHKTPVFKDLDSPPHFSVPESEHIAKGRTLLSVMEQPDTFASVMISLLIDPQYPAKGILTAQIAPSYLWGISDTGALLPYMEMIIANQQNALFISSPKDLSTGKTYLATLQKSDNLSHFQVAHHGKKYTASSWSLFMKHRFFTSGWVIILSEPIEMIMEPVSQFKIIFFLLILLTFWVVAFLSVSLIRKSLVPIETLHEGTQRIADGEFGYTLKIDSNDEFETLGHSFNEMSLKLKKSQEMLVQAAKMGTFGQMAAGIVHEIGQPLSSIMGFADMLLMSKPSAKQQKYLEIVRRELNRLATIIARFRAYSQTSAETMQPLAINGIIDDAYTLLEHQVCNKGIEFNVDKSPDLPRIAGDEDSLKQVMINLVINARDALEERPDHRQFINVKTGSDETCVYVEIEDNGSGMPPEIQKQIFDPFFTTKGRDKGTGLGLAIIDSILHKHQAQIRLESEEGVGTRFTISFPAIKDT